MVRIKQRYLLFNILYPSDPTATQPLSYISIHRPSPNHVTSRNVLSTLRNNISNIFGDHGLGVTQSSLKIVYFSPATSTCILRCPRAHFRLVWASLTFMDSLPGERYGDPRIKCVVQVVRVSGTIRKSEEELLKRARRDVVRAKLEGTGEENALLDSLVGTSEAGTLERGKVKVMNRLLDRNVGEGGIEDFDDGEEEEAAEMTDTDD
ncbi:hypothetical protein LTR84_005540 [Exophiala bonariae]|uniref:Uncharacterized protein n=1 Tax=Exophiala bonariae TaxID=1690606 RepID=A0AAV9N418_9EURO|nr:hypothetical protein LTR84_005540 [Exophiala bonariae]